MLKTQKKVKDFMQAMGLPLPNEDRPGFKKLNYKLLIGIVQEECKEFEDAMWDLSLHDAFDLDPRDTKVSWLGVIDAMCDIIVTVHNTSNAMGIDLEPFFNEVHRSNMAKVGGPKRADGKQLKPLNWTPPDLAPILDRQLERAETRRKKSKTRKF